jgi:hypothetical protein
VETKCKSSRGKERVGEHEQERKGERKGYADKWEEEQKNKKKRVGALGCV